MSTEIGNFVIIIKFFLSYYINMHEFEQFLVKTFLALIIVMQLFNP